MILLNKFISKLILLFFSLLLLQSNICFASEESSDYQINIQNLLLKGLEYVDSPYKRGSQLSTVGFDCSGFVKQVFLQSNGIELPRTAKEQSKEGVKIAKSELSEGDLLFFVSGKNINHVGIYVGENQFIHAPREGAMVRVENLEQPHWKNSFVFAKRIIAETPKT